MLLPHAWEVGDLELPAAHCRYVPLLGQTLSQTFKLLWTRRRQYTIRRVTKYSPRGRLALLKRNVSHRLLQQRM